MTVAPDAQGRRSSGRYAPLAVPVGLVAALLLIVLQDPGEFLTDTVRDLYVVPTRVLADTLSAWSDNSYLGSPNYDNGLLPIAVLTAVLDGLGAPAWLIARLVRFGLLGAGAMGAARCYTWLSLPQGPWRVGPLAAAAGFVLNPFAVTGASTLPVLLPYAVLPWLMVALARAIQSGTWRSCAVAALLFAAMGGQNAGVVPLLVTGLLVPVVVLQARAALAAPVPGRRIATALVRTGVLMVLVSLYWLVPAAGALGAGTSIAASTESPASVAATSSYAEVLRGLGLWTVYGAAPDGPFEPRFSAYLTSVPVLLASFAWPVVAAAGAVASRGRGRLVCVACLLLGAVVAVGIHPVDSPTLMGRALDWSFANMPGLIAFRTTVKAMPLVGLGGALLVAAAVAAVVQRTSGGGKRALVVLGAAGLAIIWSLPLFTGGLYRTGLNPPAYWQDLAADLDAGGDADDAGRVMVLPGQVTSHYRWGEPSPDDVLSSVLDRSSVVRTTVPATTPPAANFLAGVDLALQRGDVPAGLLSTAARYLGATEVLVRNDVVWESWDGARPAAIVRQVGTDPGLQPTFAYGAPGEQVLAPSRDGGPEADLERGLPPLLLYAVDQPRDAPLIAPTAGSLLIDGDAGALPGLQRRGLLQQTPTLLFAGALGDDALEQALQEADRIVLTDTNRRRSVDDRRVASAGSLQPASAAPAATRALFGPDEQTVQALDAPGAEVTATEEGSVFGPVPATGPALALDGDPSTAWRFGDFGTADRQALTIRLSTSVDVKTVVLDPIPSGPVRIGSVRLTTDTGSVDVALRRGGRTSVELPTGPTSSLTVEVLDTVGDGVNGVGFREVRLDDLDLRPHARLPTSLTARLSELPAAGRAALRALPLDIVLTRDVTEAEPALDRQFQLPDSRRLRASGSAALGPGVTAAMADALAGVPDDVAVDGTAGLLGQLALRPSAAVDGDPTTQWVPDATGTALEVRFPRRQVTQAVVVSGPGSGDGTAARTVRVQVGEGAAAEVPLQPGRTVVDVPDGPADRLRISLVDISGPGRPGLADVSLDGGPLAPRTARGTAAPCIEVGTLNGAPLRVRPSGDLVTVADGTVFAFGPCSGAIAVTAGEHRLTSDPDWRLDVLQLADSRITRSTAADVPPTEVRSTSATRTVLAVGGSDTPLWVTTGAAFDERWTAEVDGRDLGPPTLVNGWTAGWRLDPAAARTISLAYGPQASLQAGAAVSGATAVSLAALAVTGRGAARMHPAAVRRSPRRPRWAVVAAGAVGPVVVLVVAGVPAAVVAAAVLAWHLRRPPRTTRVTALGAATLSLVPLAWLSENRDRFGEVSFALVETARVTHHLAAVGLLLVCVGVARDVVTSPDEGSAQDRPA